MHIVFVFVILTTCVLSVEWTSFTPEDHLPPQVSKPNCLAITNKEIVCFNGFKDDCATQTNYWYDNSQVYVYNTRTNKGKYVAMKGDIPPSSAFASAWKTGNGKVVVGGGIGAFSFFYQGLENRNFTVLYELNLSTKKWKRLTPSGDIPSPRGQVSTLQDPDDFNVVYLFGGIASLGGFNFVSHAELYRYTKDNNHFELLGVSNVSRYHAHMAKTSSGELEISQGVGREHIEESVSLNSTFRFDLTTREWYEIQPSQPLPTQRRHGVEFQISVDGHLYGCLFSGDIEHEDRVECCGCIFATYTDTNLYCNAFDEDSEWVRLDQLILGEGIGVKYPGFDVLGGKLYVFSGQDVKETGQVFLDTVRVLTL